jgi:hypothetical protein
MGFWGAVGNWFASFFRRAKGVGERVFARLLPGLGSYGLPGGWTSDRTELVRHYNYWTYVAVRAIAEEIAGQTIHFAHVRSPEEAEVRRKEFGRSPRRFLRGRARTKALAQTHPHEELELLDRDHRLCELFARPNEWDRSWWAFAFRTVLYLEMTGNSYWWLIPDGTGRPCELWVMPAHWVWPSPIRRPDHLIDWYDVRPYGIGLAHSFRIPADELIHVQFPGPLSMFDGWAPLAAGERWVDIMQSIDLCTHASFKEGHRPGLIIKLDADVQDPSPEDVNRLYARLAERFGGELATHRPWILSPGADVAQDYTRTPEEMQFVTSRDQMRDLILALHRVSKTIAGITEEVNRASMETAAAVFARWTIRPKLTLLGDAATAVARRFDDGLIGYFEDPVGQDHDQKLAEINVRVAAHAMTPNEVREEFGDEPWGHGGEDPLGTGAEVPLPMATGKKCDVTEWARVKQESAGQAVGAAGGGDAMFGAGGGMEGGDGGAGDQLAQILGAAGQQQPGPGQGQGGPAPDEQGESLDLGPRGKQFGTNGHVPAVTKEDLAALKGEVERLSGALADLARKQTAPEVVAGIGDLRERVARLADRPPATPPELQWLRAEVGKLHGSLTALGNREPVPAPAPVVNLSVQPGGGPGGDVVRKFERDDRGLVRRVIERRPDGRTLVRIVVRDDRGLAVDVNETLLPEGQEP